MGVSGVERLDPVFEFFQDDPPFELHGLGQHPVLVGEDLRKIQKLLGIS